MKKTIIFLVLLASFGVVKAQDTTANHAASQQAVIHQIVATTLDSIDATMIDVRTEAEFAESQIPGAMHMNVNSPDFKDKIQLLPKDKPVLVYCRSGGRSMKAATLMEELGFQVIFNLEGGIMAWEKINDDNKL